MQPQDGKMTANFDQRVDGGFTFSVIYKPDKRPRQDLTPSTTASAETGENSVRPRFENSAMRDIVLARLSQAQAANPGQHIRAQSTMLQQGPSTFVPQGAHSKRAGKMPLSAERYTTPEAPGSGEPNHPASALPASSNQAGTSNTSSIIKTGDVKVKKEIKVEPMEDMAERTSKQFASLATSNTTQREQPKLAREVVASAAVPPTPVRQAPAAAAAPLAQQAVVPATAPPSQQAVVSATAPPAPVISSPAPTLAATLALAPMPPKRKNNYCYAQNSIEPGLLAEFKKKLIASQKPIMEILGLKEAGWKHARKTITDALTAKNMISDVKNKVEYRYHGELRSQELLKVAREVATSLKENKRICCPDDEAAVIAIKLLGQLVNHQKKLEIQKKKKESSGNKPKGKATKKSTSMLLEDLVGRPKDIGKEPKSGSENVDMTEESEDEVEMKLEEDDDDDMVDGSMPDLESEIE